MSRGGKFDILPRWVSVGSNARSGVIHVDRDGLWHANDWRGPLGVFPTSAEAEEAIRTAPARSPKKRLPRDRLPLLYSSRASHLAMPVTPSLTGADRSLAPSSAAAAVNTRRGVESRNSASFGRQPKPRRL